MPIRVECEDIIIEPVTSAPDFQEFRLPDPAPFNEGRIEGPGGIIQWYEKDNRVLATVGNPPKKLEAILIAPGKTTSLGLSVDTGQNIPGGPRAYLSYIISITRL